MAIESKLEKYQYGVNVRKVKLLYGMSGKKLYYGERIPRTNDQIIIVEMEENIAKHEAFFYRELNGHDHIIRTFGYVENNLNLTVFIQDYARYGDLANIFMDNEINISQIMLYEIFSQIADGMSYISSKSIVHGDLGCRNILVYRIDPFQPKNILIKITDFGLGRSIENPSLNNHFSIVPVRYCAPEILLYNAYSSYTEKSDVYSMGVLMWEALSKGEMPYSSISSDDVVQKMKIDDEKLIRPEICDRQFWILMEKCWDIDPTKRINFQQIKEELSDITISELSDITILELSNLSNQLEISYEFELDVDVKMNDSLDGSFGKTYDANWISEEEKPIVIIKLDRQPTEYEILFYTKSKSHPHIVNTDGFIKNNLQSILLLQERAPHNNLELFLQNAKFQPTLNVLVEIFLQIINAMIYINEQNLVHGDLRCSNILVFKINDSDPKENLIKITNFTSTCPNDPTFVKERQSKISVRYCATEIVRSAGRSNYSDLSDVYSMGVVMWQICSHGEIPYSSSILNSEVRQRKLNGEKLNKPWLCNDKIWSIMEDCWHNEPSLRYNFQQMKIRFSQINFESEKPFQYEIDVNVKIGNQLYGEFGKKFYESEWIPKTNSSIIILIMDEETARQEFPYFLKLKSNSHIVQTFGLVKNDPRLTTIVQERAPYGNLQLLFEKNQFQPTESVLIKIFLQILDAIIFIIKNNLIHGNLCCKNILVFQYNSSESSKNVIKLTNFKYIHSINSQITNKEKQIIPIRYCAPEILENNDQLIYSESSDVYSMGILMWEAYSQGTTPFESIENDNDLIQYRLNNHKLSKPIQCHDQIWKIIEDCWFTTPELRYHFQSMQDRFLNIYQRCSHCRNQYATFEILTHQELYQSQLIPISPDEHSIGGQNKQDPHPQPTSSSSLPPTFQNEERQSENTEENNQPQNLISSTDNNPASTSMLLPTKPKKKPFLERILSWFKGGNKKTTDNH